MSDPIIQTIAANLRACGITTVRQLEQIQTELLCRKPTGGNCCLSGSGMERSGAGSPVGVVTPDFIGQLYHDTVADAYWPIDLTGGTNAGLSSLSLQGQADAATLGAQLTINA